MLKIWMPKFPLKYVAVDVKIWGILELCLKLWQNRAAIEVSNLYLLHHPMSDDLELVGSDFYALWICHPGKSNLQTQDLVVD